MRTIFNRRNKEREDLGFFSKKTYVLKSVQKEFSSKIRRQLMGINDRLDQALKAKGEGLDDDLTAYIYSELTSNLLELELNINTIIMNFTRITGVRIKFEDDLLERKTSLLKRGQIFFLLDQDSSEVYGQTLIYLEEELRSELSNLEFEIGRLIKSFDGGEDSLDLAHGINLEYFKINSDMNTIIDDINSSIDSIYSSIDSKRDTNINLSFLLISAFLSLVLFFPEFNKMLNLKNQELTYEDKLDEIIYEKMMDQVSLEDLLDVKARRPGEDLLEEIEDEALRGIIKSNIDFENDKLEREKNRIKIFVTVLLVILVPFLSWIIFIVL